MKKKQLLVLMYVIMALAYALSGVVMLLAPTVWLPVFPFSYLTVGGTGGAIVLYFVRLLGIVNLALAPLFFWCARNLKKRKIVHGALSIYVLGLLVLDLLQMHQAATMPAGNFWGPFLILIVLPAALMIVAALPPLPTRVKGPREQGLVKWFNATKGFGFVTRAQGDDVFVHYRSIRGEGHRTLREGQQVEFVVVKGDKGLQAEDVQPL
jgi:CspA family cold shock protein